MGGTDDCGGDSCGSDLGDFLQITGKSKPAAPDLLLGGAVEGDWAAGAGPNREGR